ncbi:hypothetical protein MHUMG1_01336 [Metarhizium humberi]|uniref:Prenyltransferase alpha-alpha toroid domain-containing protein n=1 Tax=Metarhizium humberi TaxID=2596975 RepID=A0A9P8MKW0_9HYPO|nr:hypothetical protein MHUMG1_01336 [Metarhizium humberi]
MASLDKPRHVKYWQRCFTSYLPSAYTTNDSTRLTFAFFIVSALDLLSVPFTSKERSSIRSWVLSLQHPDGGFCGSPTHVMSGQDATKGSANLATTFFALLLLGVAAGTDDEARAAFAGVRRRKLLRFLHDIRHELGANCEETYDGGAAELSQHESHGEAGYAYCAIAALYMLDRPASSTAPHKSEAVDKGVPDRDALIHFLVHRQFNYLVEQEQDESDEGDANYVQAKLGDLSLSHHCAHVGYNGRWNKKADTCYCWWVAGTLAMVDSFHAVNIPPSRQYLLDVTQHRIGGFSKHAGGPPDLYHSYLGLAALALMGDTDLKEFDVGLCCSKETVRKIELARAGLFGNRKGDFDGDGFWESIKKAD